jgi:hypothetical protein
MIAKIEVERFSLTTSKPFDEVVAGVNAGIGHPDMAEFARSTHEARSFAELKSADNKINKFQRYGERYGNFAARVTGTAKPIEMTGIKWKRVRARTADLYRIKAA